MSAFSVRLPEYLHEAIKDLADQEGVSMNQFIAIALAEKVSALQTAAYLQQRAERGDRAKFEAAMAKVADVEPEPYDRLSNVGGQIWVSPSQDRGWVVKRIGRRAASQVLSTKKEAIEVARQWAKNERSVLVIRKLDGSIDRRHDYSHESSTTHVKDFGVKH